MRRTTSLAIVLLVAPAFALVAKTSHAADPTTLECINANESAIKLRRDRRLRESRNQYLVCALPTCPSDVRAECTRKLEEVSAGIPSFVFEVKDAAGNDLAPVKLVIDGKPLADKIEGMAISVDPGEHTFVFQAPGQPPFETTLTAREGEKERRERVVVGTAAQAPPPVRAKVEPKEAATEEPGASSWNGRKTLAVLVGGAGVVAMGVGTGFGLSASSSWSKSKTECGSVTSCPQYQQAVNDHDSAASAATVSTVAFGVGIAAVAAGIILFLTAPSGGGAEPPSGPRAVHVKPFGGFFANGASLEGRF